MQCSSWFVILIDCIEIWRSWSNPKFGFQIQLKLFVLTNTWTQGISQQTLQSLIDFIYTGRVALCQENVQVFISIPIYSVMWSVSSLLTEGCPDIFQTSKNFGQIWQIVCKLFWHFNMHAFMHARLILNLFCTAGHSDICRHDRVDWRGGKMHNLSQVISNKKKIRK